MICAYNEIDSYGHFQMKLEAVNDCDPKMDLYR